MKDYKEGVYIGWIQVLPKPSSETKTDSSKQDEYPGHLHPKDMGVKKTMLSLGKNVQFDAEQETLEAYVHHHFANDFYDHEIEIVIWYVIIGRI